MLHLHKPFLQEMTNEEYGGVRYGGLCPHPRRGKALKFERFEGNNPVDCFCRISQPKHRNRLKSEFDAQEGSETPAPRMDGENNYGKEQKPMMAQNPNVGTPEEVFLFTLCANPQQERPHPYRPTLDRFHTKGEA